METPRMIRLTPADIVAALFLRADLAALKEIGAEALADEETGINLDLDSNAPMYNPNMETSCPVP